MPSIFETKKAKILQQLSVPDTEYNDASPKGTVDEGIRGLVDEINVLDTLITTSSCAGRIAVYLEGKRKAKTNDEIEVDAPEAANAGAGGKGGGQWLFVSHDPLTEEQQAKDLTTLFGMNRQGDISTPSSAKDVRWVRCKFEPMVGIISSFSPNPSLICFLSDPPHPMRLPNQRPTRPNRRPERRLPRKRHIKHQRAARRLDDSHGRDPHPGTGIRQCGRLRARGRATRARGRRGLHGCSRGDVRRAVRG